MIQIPGNFYLPQLSGSLFDFWMLNVGHLFFTRHPPVKGTGMVLNRIDWTRWEAKTLPNTPKTAPKASPETEILVSVRFITMDLIC